MDRDEKGRFVKGNTSGISRELAREYQARSAAARKENRTLREVVRQALEEEGGGGMSKMEHLVRKAMQNHREGKLSFKDLKDLSAVLGESTLTVNNTGSVLLIPKDDEQARILAKYVTPNA